MMNIKFNWHARKANANFLKHGVTFDQAVKAVSDPFFIEWLDTREDYGEDRVNLLGMCNGVILHVTYTERDEQFWIISARRAERHEQDYYYGENST